MGLVIPVPGRRTRTELHAPLGFPVHDRLFHRVYDFFFCFVEPATSPSPPFIYDALLFDTKGYKANSPCLSSHGG